MNTATELLGFMMCLADYEHTATAQPLLPEFTLFMLMLMIVIMTLLSTSGVIFCVPVLKCSQLTVRESVGSVYVCVTRKREEVF